MSGLGAIVAAAFAGWLSGALWYSIFAKAWIGASGVKTDAAGRPVTRARPAPYLVSFLSAIIVAATMYYAFDMLGIVTVGKGFTSGLGIGVCFAAPWIATSYGFAGQPVALALLDAGYAAIGSAVIGAVVTLF